MTGFQHKRGKVYRMRQTRRAILHKKRILEQVYRMDSAEQWFGEPEDHSLHRLDKAKVHCSCPLCATKTKTDGWSHRDMKSMLNSEDE